MFLKRMIIMNEKRVKSLLKSLDINDWKSELSDEMFVVFLRKYVDKDFNNIYHLLLKQKLSNEQIYLVNSIVKLLIEKEIPVLCMNNKNQLPSDLAKEKSVFIENMLKEQINIEYQMQMSENDYNY